jgi:adenylate cyclase
MSSEEIADRIQQSEKLIELQKYADTLAITGNLLNEKELLNDPLLHIKTLLIIAHAQWAQGHAKESLGWANQALAIIDNKEGTEYRKQLAKALSIIGNIHQSLSDYQQALEYHHRSLEINEQLGIHQGMAGNYNNIGIVYFTLGDFNKALESYANALKINEEMDNKHPIARNLGNLGNVYQALNEYPKALECYTKAVEINQSLGKTHSAAMNFSNIAVLHENLFDYTQAITYNKKAVELYKLLGDKKEIANCTGCMGRIQLALGNYNASYDLFKEALRISDEIGSTYLSAIFTHTLGQLFAEPSFEQSSTSKAETYYKAAFDSSQKIGTKQLTSLVCNNMVMFYKKEQRWKDALDMKEQQEEIEKQINAEEAKKHGERLIYEQAKKQREKELAIERAANQAKQEASDNLLRKVLPSQIAKRMLQGEKQIADYCEGVTVFFCDIVGFTKLSTQISPSELVALLNEVFVEFDRIAQKHGLEKIKTIGDAYMAVAGVPLQQADHAIRATKFSLEVKSALKTYCMKKGSELQIRIGLHSGSAIAGVIGEDKFAYDIWGDTVNTAARMEQNGEAGKVNISEATYKLVKDKFACEYRGEIEAKNKGKLKMYFVE